MTDSTPKYRAAGKEAVGCSRVDPVLFSNPVLISKRDHKQYVVDEDSMGQVAFATPFGFVKKFFFANADAAILRILEKLEDENFAKRAFFSKNMIMSGNGLDEWGLLEFLPSSEAFAVECDDVKGDEIVAIELRRRGKFKVLYANGKTKEDMDLDAFMFLYHGAMRFRENIFEDDGVFASERYVRGYHELEPDVVVMRDFVASKSGVENLLCTSCWTILYALQDAFNSLIRQKLEEKGVESDRFFD
jgi:hypothetical protein